MKFSWLLLLVLTGLVALGGGWYAWRNTSSVEVPRIDPEGAEPEVVAAIEGATAEVRRSPRSAAAWGHLGMVFMAHEYDAQAQECLARAEQLEPTEGRWYCLQGLALMASNTSASIAQYQRAAQLQGDVPATRLRLAEALLGQGRLEEAEGQYHRLLDLEPRNASAYMGLARLAFRRGDWQASRDYLSWAAASPYTQKAAHAVLAEIEQRSNNPTAAARERHRAEELPDDKDWADPLIAEIEQLKVDKRARLNLAVKLAKEGRFSESITLLSVLTQQFPDWDEVWVRKGQIMLDRKDLISAESALVRAISLAPDSLLAHLYLGYTLLERHDYAAAAVRFRETLRISPEYGRAYFPLGLALNCQGDHDGAVDAFCQALRYQPNLAPAHALLGQLLAARGNKAEAVTHLRLALELGPEDATVKKMLEKLEQPK